MKSGFQQRRTGRKGVHHKHEHGHKSQNQQEVLLLGDELAHGFRGRRRFLDRLTGILARAVGRSGAAPCLGCKVLPFDGSPLIGTGDRVAAGMLRVLDLLLLLQEPDIGVIQLLFRPDQPLVIVLELGLMHVLNSTQRAMTGTVCAMNGLKPRVVILILNHLPVYLGRYRLFDDALSMLLRSFHAAIVREQKAGRGWLGSFARGCGGCVGDSWCCLLFRAMLMPQPHHYQRH